MTLRKKHLGGDDDGNKFEVQGLSTKVVVNLGTQSCTCRFWALTNGGPGSGSAEQIVGHVATHAGSSSGTAGSTGGSAGVPSAVGPASVPSTAA
ncbi:hypothetical protein VNO77_33609 [Canavalia gladiata]|uniref:Uncharacterized protein n=1 Tax=Canavalia gladiata TaxID=3824 RepID=A0AAN9PYH6_CANGL